MIRTILLVINATADSEKAENHALYLARASAAELSVIYVCDDRLIHYGEIDTLATDKTKNDFISYVETENEAECRRILKHFSVKAAMQGISYRTCVCAGDPAGKIVSQAEIETADLIIIGDDGRSGRRFLPASTIAGKVLKNSPCPVLVT